MFRADAPMPCIDAEKKAAFGNLPLTLCRHHWDKVTYQPAKNAQADDGVSLFAVMQISGKTPGDTCQGYRHTPMDNALMIGLSTQQLLRRRMDITANNLANLDTSGFKVESLVTRPLSEKPARAQDNPNPVMFAEGWQLQRDMSTGSIEQTGNPLDMAISGDGFFTVETPGGAKYTRDGAFALSPEGTLVTRQGMAVLGDGDAPIQINPAGGDISVTNQGAIMQGRAEVGRLKIVTFETPAALEKLGANLWAAAGQEPQDPEKINIAQGALEGSNVNAVVELTRMIETSRAYTSVAKMINDQDKLREGAIGKLARIR